MKTLISKTTCLLTVLSLTIISCKKDAGTGTGTGRVAYRIAAATSAPVKVAKGGSPSILATDLSWDAGYAYISDIEFKALKDGVHIKYESEGLHKIDLFHPGASLFEDTVGTAGLFTEIKLEMKIGNTGSTTEPGIKLTGKYGSTPIEFDYDESGDAFELEVEGKNYSFDKTKDYNALISLHLEKLLIGVSMADLDAAQKVNGVILINKSNNITIYAIAKQNIHNLSDVDFQD